VNEVPHEAPLPSFAAAGGLLPAIAQDARSGQVLMLAFMNEEAWRQTLATGEVHYFSRSRSRLWKKGESSGHVQRLVQALVDCDGDAILLRVEQAGGAACHTGHASCFFRRWESGRWAEVGQPVFDPAAVYGQAAD
jgi:phosphoribosyl-AMP cyclohydrolase